MIQMLELVDNLSKIPDIENSKGKHEHDEE